MGEDGFQCKMCHGHSTHHKASSFCTGGSNIILLWQMRKCVQCVCIMCVPSPAGIADITGDGQRLQIYITGDGQRLQIYITGDGQRLQIYITGDGQRL